ncbi:MAG: hypothetical protein ACTSXG_01940 [Alphaproteobacteria bacterium]
MRFLFFLISFYLYQVDAMEQTFDEQKFWQDTIEFAKTLPQYVRPLSVQNLVDEFAEKVGGKIDMSDTNAVINKIQDTKNNLDYYKGIAADSLSILTGMYDKSFEEQDAFLRRFVSREQMLSNPLLERISKVLEFEEINNKLLSALEKIVDVNKNVLFSDLKKYIPDTCERIVYTAFEMLKIAKNPKYVLTDTKAIALWQVGLDCYVDSIDKIVSPAYATLLFDVNELSDVSFCAFIALDIASYPCYKFFDVVENLPNTETKTEIGFRLDPLKYIIPDFKRTASFPRELYGYSSLEKKD